MTDQEKPEEAKTGELIRAKPPRKSRALVVDEDLAERRRKNVIRLAEIVGVNKAAATIGWSNAYLSAIKNPDRSNSRAIGSGPARQIEEAFALPKGTLDLGHPMESRMMSQALYDVVGYLLLANNDEIDVVSDLVKSILRARLKKRIPGENTDEGKYSLASL